jgi:diacylglycerol kinase family enzyme
VAPRADPGDGLFNVVFFPEHDCQALLAHMEQRLAGEAATLKPTTHRASHATISASSELEVHVDDDIAAIDGSASMDIRIQPSALRFV